MGRVAPAKPLKMCCTFLPSTNTTLIRTLSFFIVGSLGLTTYVEALKLLIDELSLANSLPGWACVRLQLEAYYRQADLYLTASQHEGFCVPLLESMVHGVPILARSSSAIPETLGEAGVLLTIWAMKLAEMAHLCLAIR
ncbi:MAG: glycosyltransferase [Chloroflexota bacterium]